VPPTRTRLADCTISAARKFGITGAIHTQPDYTVPQAWAEAFAAAGFGGIRYRVSHDPAQRELGVVLFGAAGEQSFPVRRTGKDCSPAFPNKTTPSSRCAGSWLTR